MPRRRTNPRAATVLIGGGVALFGGLAAILALTGTAQAAQAAPAGAAGFLAPLPGRPRKSSPFGVRRDPFTGKEKMHSGLDLSAPTGTPVFAPEAGTVESLLSNHATAGNVVYLRGQSGLKWAFLHLSAFSVTRGQSVARGQQVGLVGSTGASTGPHLHLEAFRDDTRIDPEPLFPPGTFAGWFP